MESNAAEDLEQFPPKVTDLGLRQQHRQRMLWPQQCSRFPITTSNFFECHHVHVPIYRVQNFTPMYLPLREGLDYSPVQAILIET